MKKGELDKAEREFKAALSIAKTTRQDKLAKRAEFFLDWINKRNSIRGGQQ